LEEWRVEKAAARGPFETFVQCPKRTSKLQGEPLDLEFNRSVPSHLTHFDDEALHADEALVSIKAPATPHVIPSAYLLKSFLRQAKLFFFWPVEKERRSDFAVQN